MANDRNYHDRTEEAEEGRCRVAFAAAELDTTCTFELVEFLLLARSTFEFIELTLLATKPGSRPRKRADDGRDVGGVGRADGGGDPRGVGPCDVHGLALTRLQDGHGSQSGTSS